MLPVVNFNRVHLVPPLTTTEEQVRTAVAILDDAITAAEQMHGQLDLATTGSCSWRQLYAPLAEPQ
jgi:hypothetical protein